MPGHAPGLPCRAKSQLDGRPAPRRRRHPRRINVSYPMKDLPALISARFRAWHRTAMTCFEGVSEEQARWRPGGGPQCLLWQLWHIARWDDRFAAIVAERARGLRASIPVEEIWNRDSVRALWGWSDQLELGLRDAGTGVSEDGAAALPFPGIGEVIAYAEAAFKRVEDAVAALDPSVMHEPAGADTDTWAANALMYLEHLPEHVAVIQALRGMQGLPAIPD